MARSNAAQKNLDDTMNNEISPSTPPEPGGGSVGPGVKRWGVFHVIKSRLVTFLLVLIFVPIACVYLQAVNPREYLGRVRLQIQPVSNVHDVHHRTLSPEIVQTQLQNVTSKRTLSMVVDELQLVRRWNDAKTPSDAYKLLLEKIETEEVKGTDLIDIEVYHTDPDEAAELANAVANAYLQWRSDDEDSLRVATLELMNENEKLQAQKMEDARQRMLELKQRIELAENGNEEEIHLHAIFLETKKEYESESLILSEMRQALQKEESLAFTKTPIVIHEFAKPNRVSSAPPVGLHRVFAGVVGMFLGLPCALFASYLMHAVRK